MMRKFLKTILTILLIISSYSSLKSQSFKGLNYNHAILNELESRNDSEPIAANNSTIAFNTLFFEDFSSYHYTVFPKPECWQDNYAFINSTYPDSMISLGVATLDAIDARGYPYYSTPNNVVPSDTLTSCPFDFESDNMSQTFFSFFYQAGGKGNRPEGSDTTGGDAGNGKDSLLLDFFQPTDSIWENVYYTLDNSRPHNFNSVVLEIDSQYLKDGFQFRFRNYTSAETNNIQGKDLGYISNNDQWHIDYIRILTTDNPTILEEINDITITSPLLPSLKTYTAVPYHHLPIAQAIDERNTIPFTTRLGFPGITDTIKVDRGYHSFNLETGRQYRDIIYFNDVLTNTSYAYNDYFTAGFQYDENKDLGEFELVAYLETDEIDQPIVNDTTRRREMYYDHYAYDDGSAEYSYGLAGETQDINGLAVRFRRYINPYKPDSLHGVLIYFAKAIDSASVDAMFQLTIRESEAMLPSSAALATVEGAFPDYSRGLNGFTRIPIDPPIAVPDTFFVVIRQLNGFVGIGYDINANNAEQIYSYTITGDGFGWTPLSSGHKGSLMIRPSFNAHDIITPINKIPKPELSINIYPNPANDRLFISMADEDISQFQFTVYNIVGIPMLRTLSYEDGIDIYHLPAGIYFIQALNRDGQRQKTLKFIKE